MRPRRWHISRFLRGIQLRTTGNTSRIPCLIPFQCKSNGISATEAEGGDAALEIAALQFIQERDEDARAAGADGMAEGHRAAIDVDFFGIEFELPRHSDGRYRESFVQFDKIDILIAVPAGFLQ